MILIWRGSKSVGKIKYEIHLFKRFLITKDTCGSFDVIIKEGFDDQLQCVYQNDQLACIKGECSRKGIIVIGKCISNVILECEDLIIMFQIWLTLA